jgi:hypothetical protein
MNVHPTPVAAPRMLAAATPSLTGGVAWLRPEKMPIAA